MSQNTKNEALAFADGVTLMVKYEKKKIEIDCLKKKHRECGIMGNN